MKKSRHQRIKELVEQFEIETQEELADRLRGDGYTVTQATVSRDIRELKLSKIPMGNGRQKYTILMQSEHYLSDKYIRVLKDGFVSMDMAQNILVVKTVSGMAMAVAAACHRRHEAERDSRLHCRGRYHYDGGENRGGYSVRHG